LGIRLTRPRGIDGTNIVGFYRDSSEVVHGFVASVPEPSSFVLLAVSALGLAAYARRKRNAFSVDCPTGIARSVGRGDARQDISS
jgi:hypothetical protein